MSETSDRRRAPAHRAQLQLVAAPVRRVRPQYVPPRRLPRRPGERREPLSLAMSPVLLAAATARGLDAGCAVELCLERALLLNDLESLGGQHLYNRLLADAAIAPVRQALPAVKARYLQMLLAARDRIPAAPDEAVAPTDPVIDVPLRLFPRVTSVADAITRARADDLDQALTLEIAGISDGRTMSEWAALAALRFSL